MRNAMLRCIASNNSYHELDHLGIDEIDVMSLQMVTPVVHMYSSRERNDRERTVGYVRR